MATFEVYLVEKHHFILLNLCLTDLGSMSKTCVQTNKQLILINSLILIFPE